MQTVACCCSCCILLWLIFAFAQLCQKHLTDCEADSLGNPLHRMLAMCSTANFAKSVSQVVMHKSFWCKSSIKTLSVRQDAREAAAARHTYSTHQHSSVVGLLLLQFCIQKNSMKTPCVNASCHCSPRRQSGCCCCQADWQQ